MFVANKGHKEDLLSKWEMVLGSKKMAALKESKGYAFYHLIFSRIVEEDFSCLYSSHKLSSANRPVNCLVAALLLAHHRNWSHKELESQIAFNVEIRVALGLKDMERDSFCFRTFYNFKNRLSNHHKKTGENLLEGVFDNLTKAQLKELKVKTNIQRGDTVLLNSNMAKYSRLSLLVEVLRRLYLSLEESEQERYGVWFSPYIKGGEKYVYEVKSKEYQSSLAEIGFVYYSIYMGLRDKYGGTEIFQIFERAYQEHFKEVQTEEVTAVEVRETKELGCETLQSPDDVEATFKKKRAENYQGYSAFGVETCHPDNEVNLITHLSAQPNQTDDAVILEKSLDKIVEKTPELDECHLDGGFGSESVDIKAEELGVVIIQTAVKGRQAKVPMDIQGDEEQGYTVSCPYEEQPPQCAVELRKSYKVVFDLDKCQNCPFKEVCPTRKGRNQSKKTAIFRFTIEDVLRQKRHKAILKIPKERRTLRSGVENMMGLMHRCEKHTGKLRVKGLFNCGLYVFAMGISINFERIFRHFFAFFLNQTFYSPISGLKFGYFTFFRAFGTFGVFVFI